MDEVQLQDVADEDTSRSEHQPLPPGVTVTISSVTSRVERPPAAGRRLVSLIATRVSASTTNNDDDNRTTTTPTTTSRCVRCTEAYRLITGCFDNS